MQAANLQILAAKQGERRAVEALVDEHGPLIVALARRRCGGAPSDDLLAAGRQGLLEALERYEPGGVAKFTTYAYAWVRLRIGEQWLLESELLPVNRRTRRAAAEVATAAEDIFKLTGRWPDQPDGAPVLPQRADFGDEDPGDLLPSDWVQPDSSAEDLAELLRGSLADLPDLPRRVLTAHFGLDGADGRTLRDLSADWGIGHQALSRALREGLDELRRPKTVRAIRELRNG